LNFSCQQCQRRYSISDEKVRGRTVKVRCKNCQNIISVEGPPAEMEESTRVVSLADVERLRAQERSLAEEETSAMPESSAEQTPWEDEPTRTMPLPSTRQPWFVMVKGKQEGPLDEAALGELIASGSVSPRNFFWQQGMADWKRGADIIELAPVFAAGVDAPPPPPPPPPPAPARPAPARPAPALSARAAPVEPEPSLTTWQTEPEGPSKTPWQPDADEVAASPARWMDEEPATRVDGDSHARAQALTQDPAAEQEQEPEAQPRTASRSDAPLGELFSDLDLPADQGGAEAGAGEDPLAALGQEPARAPVENTGYYVNKAGVNRRNPPWKIALFVLLLVGVPLVALYVLAELQVVPPLKVTRVDAQGRTVEENVSYFSSEGMGELRDRMLGQQKPPPAPPPAPAPEPKSEPAPESAPKEAPAAGETQPEQGSAPPEGEANKELQQLYADSAKADVGPEVRKDTEVAAKDSAAQAGPPQEAIVRVVQKAQPSFENCIELAMRKGSRFREGKVVLTATVGASGTVKKTAFDRRDVENSELGRCLKTRARKLVFPRFSGGDVDVEIPLILTKAL
jgi:predicted Zn finger-like uncharacterized protein